MFLVENNKRNSIKVKLKVSKLRLGEKCHTQINVTPTITWIRLR